MNVVLDEARCAAWRIFLKTHAKAIELIERELAEADLPPLSWYDVLWTLEQAPERRLRMHEIANAIVLSRSNLTRLVDRLEAADLLCRESCPSDRRGAFAALTDKGLALRQRMWPVYSQAIAKYFAQYLSDAEVMTLTQVLKRMLAAIDQAPSGQ